MSEEPDKKSAAHFLIVLLDCIEKWSLKFPVNTQTGDKSLFYKTYQELVKENVSFPSKAKKSLKEESKRPQSP